MIYLRIFALLLIANSGNSVFSQEFHYWNNQVGAKSSMLGGAVTAADKENSAIFYNPGALGFSKNSSLSLSSDSFLLSWLDIKNGAGENLNLKSFEANVYPQIIAYNQKMPILPITFTLAAISRNYSFINTSFKNELKKDLIEELPGDEYYIGTVSYYNKMRDNWVGLGYGRKISENFGIGGSVFLSIRTTELRYTETSDVYTTESVYNNLTASVMIDDYLIMRNFGLIFKIGSSYQNEKLSLGINFTIPRINLNFIGKSDLRKTFTYDIPNKDSISGKFHNWQNKIKSTSRSPFILDLGAEYKVSTLTTLYAKISWFAPISKYAIIHPKESGNSLPDSLGISTEIQNIYVAHRSIINFAIAFETEISDQLAILGSLRTDFNYFDRNAFNDPNDYYHGITYWDLYHISGGIVWKKEKFDLSVGTTYSFGFDNSLLQLVNLSNPSVENNYLGTRDNSATGHYNQLTFYFGFTYYFPKF